MMLGEKRMARCGRCGLWRKYPNDYPEKKFSGVCLLYKLRLAEDEEFEYRTCGEFLERIPGWSAKDHWEYEVQREALQYNYKNNRQAFLFSVLALLLSVLALLL